MNKLSENSNILNCLISHSIRLKKVARFNSNQFRCGVYSFLVSWMKDWLNFMFYFIFSTSNLVAKISCWTTVGSFLHSKSFFCDFRSVFLGFFFDCYQNHNFVFFIENYKLLLMSRIFPPFCSHESTSNQKLSVHHLTKNYSLSVRRLKKKTEYDRMSKKIH